jgi:hypothetical protein
MFKNMPWSSHEGDPKQRHNEEESLTSILDESQRGELTLFIASITAAMRKTIETSYDAAVCSTTNLYSLLSDILSLDRAQPLKRPKIFYQRMTR